jgi:hypothetical protein
MPLLSGWQALFALQAGAAATLTGLVFVAVSINLAKILAFPGLPSRAAESIIQFLQVFFICTGVLIPRQPGAAVAVEVLTIAPPLLGDTGCGDYSVCPVAGWPSPSLADDPDCADAACEHSPPGRRNLPAE